LRAYLLKALLSSADLIGRAFIFNREPPPVRGVVSGLSYGKHRQQRLDVVLPNGPPPYPTLLYIHGGGWIAGDKKSYERICRLFASEGHLVLNMNYRLAPRHHFPAPAQDVALAVQWAHAHGERWGADLSTLFLAGDSAGAHLASLYALALGRPELLGAIGVEGDGSAQAVQGLVLFYGVYDLTRFAADAPPYVRAIVNAFLGPGGEPPSRRAELASPLRHVGPGMPPCFVCAGERDALFEQSAALVERLTECGVPHRSLLLRQDEYPGAGHGFLNLYRRRCSEVAFREALRFMRSPQCPDG
jgi:acetyl esterase/lipase